MAAKSTYLSDALLAALLDGGSFTGPATIYVALNTTTSTPVAPGTECADASYSRQVITFGTVSAGQVTQTGAVTGFLGAGAAGSFTVAEIAFYDAPTGGNELYYGMTDIPPVFVNPGDTVSLADGALTVSELGVPIGTANLFLGAVLNNQTITGGPVYAALNNTFSSPSTPGNEIVDPDYARQAITFEGAVAGFDVNANVLSFFSPGAQDNRTIVEVAIYDNPTSGQGNELFYTATFNQKTVSMGDNATVQSTQLVVTES